MSKKLKDVLWLALGLILAVFGSSMLLNRRRQAAAEAQREALEKKVLEKAKAVAEADKKAKEEVARAKAIGDYASRINDEIRASRDR